MRKEFILVLLGIISISTLSSLLSGYVHVDYGDKVLLDTVVGSVGAGNFSYWQSGHIGPLLIELTSLSGDADLYISDTTRPSYETDKNNFSSATCGPDFVHIPAEFPRPIGIGVFGHWSHSATDYSIQVFLDATAIYNLLQYQKVESSEQTSEKSESDSKQSREKPHQRKEEENKPRFLKLLNILDMMFEMFVM